MSGLFIVWRRKKMRCVIAGCLGISALLSLILVIGSPNAHAILADESFQIRDYPVKYAATGHKTLSQGRGHPDGNLMDPNKIHDKNNDRNHLKGNKDDDDSYDNNEDDYDDDNGYYDNKHASIANQNKGVRIPLPVNKKPQDGFVIEDNAQDYDDDYNQDGYEDNEDNEEDYQNPTFKKGDFDYTLLNKSKSVLSLKFEEIHSNRTKHHQKISHKTVLVAGQQKYNAGQYKSMHLLETSQHDRGSFIQNNSEDVVDHEALANSRQNKLMSSVGRSLPRAKIHNTPCTGLDCPSEKHGVAQGLISKLVNRTEQKPLISNQNDHKSKRNSQSVQNNKKFQSHSLNINKDIKNRIPNVVKINPKIQPLHEVVPTYGYLLNGVNTFTNQNAASRDHIETQIPIQDGGHDANWLLQEQPATQIQMPELPWQPGEVRSPGGIPLVVDKIFWSKEVEDLVATGITDEEIQHFLHKLYTTPVKEMYAPQWNRCGRPRNQFIRLKDKTPLCARFREEHAKLLHGEVLSFYLSRILGLDNVPIVVLSEANSSAPQWQGMDLSAAGWNESSIVALIQWVDGLESERSRVKMPAVILEAYEHGGVFDSRHREVSSLNANNLTQLIQWSDLILLDYLTGHYDRVASMQDGADRERKPSIMHENIRNLRKVWQSDKMWLIDNESGLFDGYELLYHGGEMGRKFVEFHTQMLRTNCVFRKETVQKIFQLAGLPNPHEVLVKYARAQDPLYHKLPYAKEITLFNKYFHVRLKEVAEWIKKCQAR